jgi:20S proteasome alpha/beta subunit
VEKRVTSTLLETSSVEKIVEIDKHIGCAISGLQADSRTLIEHARYVGGILSGERREAADKSIA